MTKSIIHLSPLARWEGNQRRIAITGGIGSGKSSVSNYISSIYQKIPIFDADTISKEILSPGSKISQLVIERYGKLILDKNNFRTINRKKLGTIIFKNKHERIWLQKLIHPKIHLRLQDELTNYKDEKTLIFIIPLLFECNMSNFCNEVWLIYCTQEQQYKRIRERDNLSFEEAKNRINSQLSIDEKRKFSDITIDNTKEKGMWKRQINNLLLKEKDNSTI